MQSLLILGLERHSHGPTKGVGKIGEHDVGRIVCLYTHIDKLISQKISIIDQLLNAKKRRLKDLVMLWPKNLQMKSIEKQLHFLIMNLMLFIIPPFEVSNQKNKKDYS